MSNNIREIINKGYITEYLSELLREKYNIYKVSYPNSWDREFIENMLGYRKKLSNRQINQLERILGDKIFDQEFPGGLPDILKSLNQTIEEVTSYPVLEKKELLMSLIKLGFSSYMPRTSSWRDAYIASNNTSTLYLLVGKRGIDFKIYNCIRETRLDERGRLYTDGGGQIIRNYYNRSRINIHSHILELAHIFIENKEIDESFLSGLGVSPLHPKQDETNDMVQIYKAVCHEEGKDAYLGDRIYIRPDGSLYED